jgi:hypothetical protein
LGGIAGAEQRALRSRSWIDEWLLGKLLLSAFEEWGLNAEEQYRALAMVKILTTHQLWFEPKSSEEASSEGTRQERPAPDRPPGTSRVLRALLGDTEIQEYLRINRYQEILWYHDESLDQLLTGLYLAAAVEALSSYPGDPVRCARLIHSRKAILDRIHRAKENSQYEVERLLAAVSD